MLRKLGLLLSIALVGAVVVGTGGALATHSFPDVPDDAFYSDAVDWAYDNGITTGYGDTGRFEPNRPTTRGQMVTFLKRLDDLRPETETLVVGGWAFNPFSSFERGAFNGCASNLTSPNSLFTSVGLPVGARITKLRFDYRDTLTGNQTLQLNRTRSDGSGSTLVTATSSGAGGFGQTTVNLPTPEVVDAGDNIYFSYTPTAAGLANGVCSVAVTYRLPTA